MSESKGSLEFRFYYFTNQYADTVHFYKEKLGLAVERSWDRGPGDKGTIFRSPNGTGLIEIEEGDKEPALQGGLYIEVEDVDKWYQLVLDKKIQITQTLSNTSYGHRSFRFEDTGRLAIGLFSYLVKEN